MAIRFTPFVGRRRLASSLSGSMQTVTRSARAQFQDIQRQFNALLDDFKNVTPEALEGALQPIFARSQELVPVDTGDLKASGYIVVQRHGSVIEAEIGYGKGGIPNYAVFVHENMEMPHKPPTQAKFLQQAIQEQLGMLRDRLLRYYTAVFGPGV